MGLKPTIYTVPPAPPCPKVADPTSPAEEGTRGQTESRARRKSQKAAEPRRFPSRAVNQLKYFLYTDCHIRSKSTISYIRRTLMSRTDCKNIQVTKSIVLQNSHQLPLTDSMLIHIFLIKHSRRSSKHLVCEATIANCMARRCRNTASGV